MMERLARGLCELGSKSGVKYALCVTGDHSTPVEYGDHSCEPVPFAICSVDRMAVCLEAGHEEQMTSGGYLCDEVDRFDEMSAVRGALGRFQGSEVMSIIKRFSRLLAKRE
mmetsp:Transcript_54161/g.131059  ORF Transcript_54161/g.131059 Transcript_54161/m.131059 type:complete len:111 (+) Transcript_54161:1063-1395(+)